MKPQTRWMSLVSACGAVLLLGGVTPARAQEAHVGGLTGHAAAGKPLYTRYCAGCHGDDGDALGENAQWIDPKPRDFTLATFKCRSTPSGSLPTDQDVYNTVARGFVTTNMPPWIALTPQNRIDMVAYIKTFYPAGGRRGPAHLSPFHPNRRRPRKVFCTGGSCFSAWNAGNATVPRAMATDHRRPRSPTTKTCRFIRTTFRPARGSCVGIPMKICTAFS